MCCSSHSNENIFFTLAGDDDEFKDTEGGMLWLEAMVSQIDHPSEIPTSLIFGDIFI